MPRRRTNLRPLTIQVSHEASRLEQHVMADAFERLLPIIERRLRSRPDTCGSPGQATSDTILVPRKKPA
ncbi:hypothetical protein CCS01_11595 [Rhodopila globiformis]|uniref:Uncharacterized protein n=1 Tax=Rhodopila globiformis TaxID=1071 RepID=A0A2S6NI66_RHOGL|nr:hypothetical protein CCS01_11595 [Rhodopila globiformis]